MTTTLNPTPTSTTPFIRLLDKILIGIDRFEFSIPALLYLQFIHRLYEDGTGYRSYTQGNYRIVIANVLNTRIKVKNPIVQLSGDYHVDRVYIEIFNLGSDVFEYIKNTLLNILNHYFLPVSSIKIKQLEVKYDFYSNFHNNSYCYAELRNNNLKIKRFLDRHVVLKYSRSNSCKKEGTTNYFGKKGNIRKGKSGTRTYIKDNKYIPGTTFCRLEFQYNASYFYKKKITINDLPFNPLSFESFKHVDLWSDISDKGMTQIAKAILKKQGITSITSQDTKIYNKKLREKQSELSFVIQRKQNNQLKSIHQQFSAIKDLKKIYKFTMNHKEHFKVLTEDTQLILCHADISFIEDRCSKRMLLCRA